MLQPSTVTQTQSLNFAAALSVLAALGQSGASPALAADYTPPQQQQQQQQQQRSNQQQVPQSKAAPDVQSASSGFQLPQGNQVGLAGSYEVQA